MITSTEKSLKVLDKIGMLSSVEARAPYLDRALVEFSTRLPASFDGGRTYVSLKTHLKKGFEDALPREVLERRVIGYPNYYWSQGELSEIQRRVFAAPALTRQGILRPEAVGEILDHDAHSDAKSAGKRSWALTQLCLWHKVHVEGAPIDSLLQPA